MNPLLNADQAGELLNVPASWVLAEARAERIPHVRLGRYVRFDADDLETWWHARRARGPRINGASQAGVENVARRLSDQGRQVLEIALREALMSGHNYIGSEHIRSALDRVEETE